MLKSVLPLIACFSVSHASAESTPMGCAVRTYDCNPQRDGMKKCSWGSDEGYLYSVDLQRTGISPKYEIWEGQLNGKARAYKYQISVYQRREPNKKVSYLTADLIVGDVKVTGQGENTVEARYLIEAKSEGIGIHCSLDVTQAP